MTDCRHLVQPDINKGLVEAVWIGHVNCVKKLLEEGADVNADNTAGNNVLITFWKLIMQLYMYIENTGISMLKKRGHEKNKRGS